MIKFLKVFQLRRHYIFKMGLYSLLIKGKSMLVFVSQKQLMTIEISSIHHELSGKEHKEIIGIRKRLSLEVFVLFYYCAH